MNRWGRVWHALATWWRSEAPPPFPRSEFLPTASKALEQYDDIYCRRLKIPPGLSSQAAAIVLQEGHQRPATIESEVRMLAITVERILRHLQVEDQERESARREERMKYSKQDRLKGTW